MDFGDLKEALASQSYAQIADICDHLMLQVVLIALLKVLLCVSVCVSGLIRVHRMLGFVVVDLS